jgi:chromosomal replication initiator protein
MMRVLHKRAPVAVPTIPVVLDEPDEAAPVWIPSLGRPISHIQEVVALSYGLDPRHMRSADRRRAVCWPRQVAMYLTRKTTWHSLPAIGRFFGYRDHTTVLWAIRAVEKRMASDPLYRADVVALREALS